MAGFIFDLARRLARSTAADLRGKAAGPPLTRAEILAVATVLDLLSLEPAGLPKSSDDWPTLELQARNEFDFAEQARSRGRAR